MQAVTSRLLYLSGSSLTEREDAIGALSKAVVIAGGLAPGGRLHFNRPSELMLVLGFLFARKMPVKALSDG